MKVLRLVALFGFAAYFYAFNLNVSIDIMTCSGENVGEKLLRGKSMGKV